MHIRTTMLVNHTARVHRVPKEDFFVSRPHKTRRDHVARRRRRRPSHAESRARRAFDTGARLRLEVRPRRSPWTPLSRPSARALSVIRVPSTAPALVPPNVERAEAFRARDTGHGTSRPAAFYVPSGHRGRAGASRAEASSSPRRPGRATESALARRSIRHRSVRLAEEKRGF